MEEGEQDLPRVLNYTYLGINFAESGAWDVQMKMVMASGKKVNQFHSDISNRDVILRVRRLLLLAVVRPIL